MFRSAERRPDWLSLGVTAGLALGIVLGMKYAALPLLAALVPCLFLVSLVRRGGLRRTQLMRAMALEVRNFLNRTKRSSLYRE